MKSYNDTSQQTTSPQSQNDKSSSVLKFMDGKSVSSGPEILAKSLRTRSLGFILGSSVEGPRTTTYKLRSPGSGNVHSLRRSLDDLALDLGVPAVRLTQEAGELLLEVPRADARIPTVWELHGDGKLERGEFIVGIDTMGQPVKSSLSKAVHIALAGASGSGKSVAIDAILWSLLSVLTPNELRLCLIDPKRVELAAYTGLPHLAAPIISDDGDAVALLDEMVDEMESRYTRLNQLCLSTAVGRLDIFPYVVLVIDEFADLTAGPFKEDVLMLLTRLAQKSRAVNMHMILATQRPSAKVLTGELKANLSSKLALRTASSIDSRVIGIPGAEKLLGKGDAIWSCAGTTQRIQAPMCERKDILELKRRLAE